MVVWIEPLKRKIESSVCIYISERQLQILFLYYSYEVEAFNSHNRVLLSSAKRYPSSKAVHITVSVDYRFSFYMFSIS